MKKIALISDLAGYGRCAMSISIPMISSMKVQCCPLPTSIFSNHTGYDTFHKIDLTEDMLPIAETWKQIGASFEGILTGYLASEKQMDVVTEIIRKFRTENTVVVVDPIMGDHGKTYAAYTPQLCERMKELVRCADVVTPNLTEACILTDTPYKDRFSRKEVLVMAEKLLSFGAKKVVITGLEEKSLLTNLCLVQGETPRFISVKKAPMNFHGTGDIFTSIVAAEAVQGGDFYASVRKASKFVKKCIEHSIEQGVPEPEGMCFEELLHFLDR